MIRQPLKNNDFMAILRGLNFWTIKQRIKDATIQKASTFQLFQRIDIIKWNNPAEAQLNQRMLELYTTIKIYTNPNIRFQPNLSQIKNRFIAKHGKLRASTGQMRSHSFVIGFMQALEVNFAHTVSLTSSQYYRSDPVNIKDTGGTVRTIWEPYSGSGTWFGYEAPGTSTLFGILVGTGTTAPTTNDYTMETLIAQGTGSGQMYYGATGVGGAMSSGTNCDMVVVRVIGNSSGGSITIREVGLAAAWQYSPNTPWNYYFLHAHDAVNQAVANGESAICIYTFRTTV